MDTTDRDRSVNANRMSRRTLLVRGAQLGMGASLAPLLAGADLTDALAAGKVSVNLWESIPPDTEKYWKARLLPTFYKRYPSVTIVTRQLGTENPSLVRAGLRAGGSSAPDMVWISSGEQGAYAEAGVLADVDGWLNSNPKIKSDIFSSLIKLSSFKGKVASLPWMTNNTAMWLNLNAFHQAGVSVPSQNPEKTWTWDEFESALAKISKKVKGMKAYMMPVNSGGWEAWLFHAWLGAVHGVFLHESGTPGFNDAKGVKAMTFLKTLVDKGYCSLSSSPVDAGPWFAGKVAITTNGPWNFPTLSTFKGFKFTVVPFPRADRPATNTGGDQLYVFDLHKNAIPASLDYAGYMLSDPFQIAFNIQSGNLPVTRSATASKAYQQHLKKYPFLYGFVNQVPYGVARSSLPKSTDVQTIFAEAYDQILEKGANVKQALDSAAARAKALPG